MKLVKITRIEMIFLVGVLLAGLFVLGFIRLNLSQTSNQAMRQFAQQNRFELAAADSMILATKLNAMMASESVYCVFGRYEENQFVDAKKGHCGSGILTHRVRVEGLSVPELEIYITYRMPSPLVYSAVTLLLAQVLSIFVFFKLYRDKIEISNLAKERLVEIANQVAHDIRSPLSALNMALSNIKDLDSNHKDVLTSVSLRISEIANELLAKSRGSKVAIDTGVASRKKTSSVEKVDLLRLVSQNLIEKKLEYKDRNNIHFIEDYDQNVRTFIIGSSVDIQRILSNLINNSIEASLDGETNTITVSVRIYAGKTDLSISDTGKGMSPEIVAKLGTKGFTSGKSEGNGLGVYDAKTKVESWGGRFQILSQVDSGTLVTLTLTNYSS